MEAEGTDSGEGCSGDWYFVTEAECSDVEDEEEGSFSSVADFLDETEVDQGNSLSLFHQQQVEDDERQLQTAKRKYQSPREAVVDLSPRLSAICISPEKQRTKAKKRLFTLSNDSGLEVSLQNETLTATEESFVQVELPSAASGEGVREDQNQEETNAGDGGNLTVELMRCSNQRATLLAKFKACVGVSFAELTRVFKSDKTCYSDWVCAVFGVSGPLCESFKTLLPQYCEYMHLTVYPMERCGYLILALCSYKASKSRETVVKLLRGLLDVADIQIMAEPPKVRSVPAALFWYKTSFTSSTCSHGPFPDWLSRQTMISHQNADAQKFELADMIQWAYDADLRDECTIAYEYAKLADINHNAAAWLSCNNQAKYVKDCAKMVNYYKRAEMQNMTISAWIDRCMKRVSGDGDWKPIALFLRYQGLEFIVFLKTLRDFLKGTPKRNCILIHGPPNTGKSLFCMSLIQFLSGKIISHVNSKSHFWLQPLADAKVALLDDATRPCLDYFDTYLRNALDGNPVSLDCKHKAPVQLKCPPLLITSNIDIKTDDRWRYLYSRIKTFKFGSDFPFNEDGTPIYAFSDANWKCFFKRLWSQLELSDQEDEGEDGDPEPAFRCGTRKIAEPV
nr:MAG: E1 protein [Hydrurga leptonyx papillomavirus 2]